MTLRVAIVGSGPAGCYLAEKLVRDAPGARIDIIERLPVPFGLVRAGVAPDHQGTKSVTRLFERLLDRDGVAFFGSVEVGRDVALEELQALYDVVVLATGAPIPRRLGIVGEELPGVVSSGDFVGWVNRQPDSSEAAPPLAHVRSVVIVGNGNVALDVARVIAKTPAEMAGSDLAPEVEATLAAMPLREIHIVGRRGAGDTRFSPQELSELGILARAEPVVAAADLPAQGAEAANPVALELLRGFAAKPRVGASVAIRFHFDVCASAILGTDRVEAMRFTRPAGEGLTLPADLVVTCIGYRTAACGALAPTEGGFLHEVGRIAEGLYVVGWAGRSPSGTIATTRAEAHAVGARILAEATTGSRPGAAGLRRLLSERGFQPVDRAGWRRIDAAEVARAAPGRVRHKFGTVAELVGATR